FCPYTTLFRSLETVNRRLERVQKLVKQRDKDGLLEHEVLLKVKEALEADKPVRSLILDEDERRIIQHLHLLTIKPVLYVANVGENDIHQPEENEHVANVKNFAAEEEAAVIVVWASVE